MIFCTFLGQLLTFCPFKRHLFHFSPFPKAILAEPGKTSAPLLPSSPFCFSTCSPGVLGRAPARETYCGRGERRGRECKNFGFGIDARARPLFLFRERQSSVTEGATSSSNLPSSVASFVKLAWRRRNPRSESKIVSEDGLWFPRAVQLTRRPFLDPRIGNSVV